MDSSTLLGCLGERIRPPVGIILGSPREAAALVTELSTREVTCYQMDLYQADRLRQELAEFGQAAEVATAPDLWDLPQQFQTVIYPAPEGGERSLKIDMIEQAFHALRANGMFAVLSPFERDPFFPPALKKVFGRVHAPGAANGRLFYCHRDGDRPRRRHEMTFNVRVDEGPSLHFISRPGVFSYGRFDNGARALVEVMEVNEGERVLDLGCGCGTNGVYAGRKMNGTGHVTFADSNLRAIALAELNARNNGLASFETVVSASAEAERLGPASFDVILANPPYYANSSIAQMFIERSRDLLKPGGRFYLVTKQPDEMGPRIADAFGVTEPILHRGYTVLAAQSEETSPKR